MPANLFPRARACAPERTGLFTVVFYGLQIFCCKRAQFCVTQRESEMAETPSAATLRKPVKTHAKTLS
jgi:hypothetical protein